jgi:hypothetical protein
VFIICVKSLNETNLKLQKKDKIIKHLQKKLDSFLLKNDKKSINDLSKNMDDQKQAVICYVEQLDALLRNKLNPAVSNEPIDFLELSKVIQQIINVNKTSMSNNPLEQEFALLYVSI